MSMFYGNMSEFDNGDWDSYNHFHNILKVFDVLTIFPFTASETMRDYYF